MNDFIIEDGILLQYRGNNKHVVIPDNVTYIGGAVFMFHYEIESITIPDSVVAIWDHAFKHCTSIRNISLPNGITYIGRAAFQGCFNLRNINIPNNLKIIDKDTFNSCDNIETISIPNGVTAIEESAFGNCRALNKIIIPNSVRTIGFSAFSNCISLEEITIPEGVNTIDSYAFKNCSHLSKITIPNSVKKMGSDVFDGCTLLPQNDVDQILSRFKPNENLIQQLSTIDVHDIMTDSIQAYISYFTNKSATHYDSITIDTETTGFTAGADEILQLALIDDNNNIIYNQHFKPEWHTSWDDAQKVNRISPESVVNCPTFREELIKIIPIIYSAKRIIGYNTSFDLGMLKAYGVLPNNNVEVIDVMRDFAPIYGEWNDKKNDWKWKKLGECAAYYNYEWGDDQAHDALADCKATLYCYKKMKDAYLRP